jgi:hypothetical protein
MVNFIVLITFDDIFVINFSWMDDHASWEICISMILQSLDSILTIIDVCWSIHFLLMRFLNAFSPKKQNRQSVILTDAPVTYKLGFTSEILSPLPPRNPRHRRNGWKPGPAYSFDICFRYSLSQLYTLTIIWFEWSCLRLFIPPLRAKNKMENMLICRYFSMGDTISH